MKVRLAVSIAAIAASASGEQWQQIPSPIGFDLVDLRFVSEATGYALGTDGLIRTDNGGTDWRIVNGEGGGAAIWFWDADSGLLLETDSDVLKTTDGGITWESINRFLPRYSYGSYANSPRKLFFHDKQTGWAMLNESLWRTFDGGKSWEISSIEFPEEVPPTHKSYGSCCHGYHLRDIWFSDEQTGFAVGGYYDDVGGTDNDDGPLLYKTDNGGDDWRRVSFRDCTCLLGGLFGIAGRPPWIAATGERVFKNVAGDSWVKLAAPEGYDAQLDNQWGYIWGEFNWGFFTGVRLDDQTGWVAGNRIAHTADGGDSWMIESGVGELGTVFRMEKAGNRLVAVGVTGLILIRDLPGASGVFPASWGEVKNR